MELIYPELSYAVRGALYDVYNALGPGFAEETYKIATLAELGYRGIGAAREQTIAVEYRGVVIDTYRLDIVIEGKIILELKAVEQLHPRFEAQLLSYLRASGLKLGILANFGSNTLQMIRRANSKPKGRKVTDV
jgi:GxxExxY protein